MSANLIDGKATAASLKEQLKREAEQLKDRTGVVPGLTVILVGEDPASQVYVNSKAKDCEQVGFRSEVIRLPAETKQEELLGIIDRLNGDSRVHGILVQLPLPGHISEEAVIERISPSKDVDGFHPVSVGHLMIGTPGFLPCTPAGIIELIKRSGIEMSGKRAVVVGRSNIVGKPVSILLLRENATVTVCHSRTKDLESVCREADILVAAIGRPKFIGASHVKPGAVVIDVGVNRLDNGKLAGDVDFDAVKDIAGYLTPVPGGVGPMTRAMLLMNTMQSAKTAAAAR